MKRLLLLVDAAGDFPYPELQDRTPLECARMPTAKAFATEGHLGRLRCRRIGPDASRSFLAEAMGFTARSASRLRWGPLGVLAHGEPWGKGRLAYLAHLIHVDQEGSHHPVSVSSDKEQADLLQDLEQELQETLPDIAPKLISLSPGRFVLTFRAQGNWLTTSPVMYQQAGFVQRVDPILRSILEQIRFQLEFHPMNELRLDLGELPITTAWCWSGGHRIPEPPPRAFSGALMSPDPVIKGLAALCGVPFASIPDPYQDEGAEFPLDRLEKLLEENEEVILWLPAPFASEQFQEPQEKVRRLDGMDYRLLDPIRNWILERGQVRLLLAAAGVRHRGRPERGSAPCLLWSPDLSPDAATGWTEAAGGVGLLGSPRWSSLLQTFRK